MMANTLLFGGLFLMQLGLFDSFLGSDDGDEDSDETDDTAEAAPVASEAETPETPVSQPDPNDFDNFQPSVDEALFATTWTGGDMVDTIYEPDTEENMALYGAGDDDSLWSGTGRDLLVGEAGDDELIGHWGDDTLDGGDGADRLWAGYGNDLVVGGAGNDTADGSLGHDTLYGGAGADQLQGAGGDDLVFGGSGDDMISSDRLDTLAEFARGTDTLYGGSGDDRLILGPGDTGTGGTGADMFEVIESTDHAGAAAVITDFDPAVDKLELFFEPRADGSVPELTQAFDATTGQTSLSLDGQPVALLAGNIQLSSANLALTSQDDWLEV